MSTTDVSCDEAVEAGQCLLREEQKRVREQVNLIHGVLYESVTKKVEKGPAPIASSKIVQMIDYEVDTFCTLVEIFEAVLRLGTWDR